MPPPAMPKIAMRGFVRLLVCSIVIVTRPKNIIITRPCGTEGKKRIEDKNEGKTRNSDTPDITCDSGYE